MKRRIRVVVVVIAAVVIAALLTAGAYARLSSHIVLHGSMVGGHTANAIGEGALGVESE